MSCQVRRERQGQLLPFGSRCRTVGSFATCIIFSAVVASWQVAGFARAAAPVALQRCCIVLCSQCTEEDSVVLLLLLLLLLLAGLRELFKSIDSDNSGTITVEEMRRALTKWGHKIQDVSGCAVLTRILLPCASCWHMPCAQKCSCYS
jgi:hypothetical protein